MIAYYRWVPLMWLHSEPFVSLRAGVPILFYCKMPRTNSMEWFQSVSDAVNCISECLICSLNGLNDCSCSPVAPEATMRGTRTMPFIIGTDLFVISFICANNFLPSSCKETKPRSFLIITILCHNRANSSCSALHNMMLQLTAHRNKSSVEV